jgi:hypothetical protein
MLISGCKNVVLKNIKTNTVQVAKLDVLFELGDTILYNNVKHEIIRKRLSNGNIVKKEPIVRVKQQVIPPPSKKQ